MDYFYEQHGYSIGDISGVPGYEDFEVCDEISPNSVVFPFQRDESQRIYDSDELMDEHEADYDFDECQGRSDEDEEDEDEVEIEDLEDDSWIYGDVCKFNAARQARSLGNQNEEEEKKFDRRPVSSKIPITNAKVHPLNVNQ